MGKSQSHFNLLKLECTDSKLGLHTPAWDAQAFFFGISRCQRKVLGPGVQSIVSLTSSLRVISLTVLADSIYNILIFFAEIM